MRGHASGGMPAVLVALTLGAAFGERPAAAQLVRGTVMDETSGAPVTGAMILLLDAGDTVATMVHADDRGAFELRPLPGRYRLRVMAAGYFDVASDAIDFEAGIYPVELFLQRRPIEVEGVEVTAPRHEQDLRRLGVRPDEIGRRLIVREDIDQRPSARDVGEIIQWQGIPGVRIVRRENLARGLRRYGVAMSPQSTIDFCVTLPRGRRADAHVECALLILDGRATTEEHIKHLDPDEVEAIVVMTPSEAAQLFGTGTYGGAVAIYTRRGGGGR